MSKDASFAPHVTSSLSKELYSLLAAKKMQANTAPTTLPCGTHIEVSVRWVEFCNRLRRQGKNTHLTLRELGKEAYSNATKLQRLADAVQADVRGRDRAADIYVSYIRKPGIFKLTYRIPTPVSPRATKQRGERPRVYSSTSDNW